MTGLYHGWDGEKDNHADFKHGAVAPSDFEEGMPHRKKRGKKRPPKKKGCEGNDFGPHVYVWVPQIYQYSWWPEAGIDPFYKKYGYYRREVKTCCGCNKTTGASRYTEQFAKRVAKMGWYEANYGD